MMIVEKKRDSLKQHFNDDDEDLMKKRGKVKVGQEEGWEWKLRQEAIFGVCLDVK